MVSLWPWKTNDTTSSFEKTLSSISGKITKANVARDSLRARSRRFKALWTIYTTLTYIFCSLILVLVTGWQNWHVLEYGVVIGAPFLIYAVRMALSYYYTYRLANNQAYLDELNKQRDTAIEKFKTATKYNTTQQLLEKYGAAPAVSTTSRVSPSSAFKMQTNSNNGAPRFRPNRTNIPPPPTANIRRPEETVPAPQTPQQPSQRSLAAIRQGPYSTSPREASLTEEFAPNAFTAPAQYSSDTPSASRNHKWYDRILDVILGEDESRPINRLALICSQCRLVNGLAPPGAKTLEDVGKWRCSGCGNMNGQDIEVKRIVDAVGLESESSPVREHMSEADAHLHHEKTSKVPEMLQKSQDIRDGAENMESVTDREASTAMSEGDANTEVSEDVSSSESPQETLSTRTTRSQSKKTRKA